MVNKICIMICHSNIYTLSLVLSMYFRARHSCANSLLCSTLLFACLRCILHVGLCCGAIWGTCLVVCAIESFAWIRSVFSPTSYLCDGWGTYSCIWNCYQGAMGGEFAIIFFTFCRATLSYFPNTASIDCDCNQIISFLYSWSIFVFAWN